MKEIKQLQEAMSRSQIQLSVLRNRREAYMGLYMAACTAQDHTEMQNIRLQAETLLNTELDEIATQAMLMTQIIQKSHGL